MSKSTRPFAWAVAMLAAFVVAWLLAAPSLETAARLRREKAEAARRESATHREISWGEGAPSFAMLGFEEKPKDMPGAERGRPGIMLACRWREAPVPWNRYELIFPKGETRYPDGMRISAGISPLTADGFVIHYYFDHAPTRMEAITIPISCRDRKTGREWEARELSFSYWPDVGETRLALLSPKAGT